MKSEYNELEEKKSSLLSYYTLDKKVTKSILFFLIVIIIVSVFYLNLRSKSTSLNYDIVELEEEISSLKEENDTIYNNTKDTTDIESIRNEALNEYGMVYSNKSHVVEYDDNKEDSVTKYNSEE